MSAITGIFYRKGKKVDPQLIQKMNDKLSHRGVDGSHTWVEDNVGLGHQMLHTTPESLHEKLPFIEEDLVITADARIDNREELAKKLDIADEETVSDSYFILKAYEKWGEDCPDKLLGDFAFAIWDRKKEILFCARDHMGVKPFYYYVDEEMFVFGTEIKALFCVDGVPREINEFKLADHLSLLFEDKKTTFYNEIFRLAPAHIIKINKEFTNFEKYWELDINKEITMKSDEEYAKAFYKLFHEAVNCRLRSAFPVGSLLSGGLDSSSIVCTADKILSNKNADPIKTYSATFEKTPQCDETFFINKVIESGKIEHYFIKADELSPLYEIDNILWHLEEPHFAVNFYFHWKIHQKCKKTGVRVILEGLDGDTTVSHGERFEIDYFRSFKWIKCIKEAFIHSKRSNISLIKFHFLKSFLLPYIPEFFMGILKKIHIFGLNNSDLIKRDFAIKTGVEKRLRKHEKKLKSAKSSKSYHYLKLNSGLITYILEMVDKSAATSNLEARYPFFDRRLIEFCLALPIDQKIKNGWTRIIMRNAMDSILPSEIQWRADKGNLSLNFKKNLLFFEKDTMNDLFLNNYTQIEDYVNISLLKKSYEDYISSKKANVLALFGIMTIIIWIQKISKK